MSQVRGVFRRPPGTILSVVVAEQRQGGALRLFVLLVSISWTLALSGCAVGPRPLAKDLGRCVWVNRWDYESREQIDEIMRRVAAAGFDTVFFQVRGNGTVYYSSRTEVWSEAFDHQAPGFDPLSYAVVAAHAYVAYHAATMIHDNAFGGFLLLSLCWLSAIYLGSLVLRLVRVNSSKALSQPI